ncbi:hypothetical protein M116_2409 [Bacteroides fragilis str. 3719 A10]|nr:hypothetical protein M116_2409 [Bacteroides fragilis str. 3719 A10]
MHCFKKAMHFLSVLQKKYNVSIFLISDLLYQQYKKVTMDYLFFYLFFLFIIWTFIVKSIHDAPEMEDIE